MDTLQIHGKGMASGHVRAGATVGEALEQLGPDVSKGAVAAKVDGREVDLAYRLEPSSAGGRAVEVEPLLEGTLEGLGVSWPQSDADIVALLVLYGLAAATFIGLQRRRAQVLIPEAT